MDEYRKLQRERQDLVRDREEFTKQCTEERRNLARELADVQSTKEVPPALCFALFFWLSSVI